MELNNRGIQQQPHELGKTNIFLEKLGVKRL